MSTTALVLAAAWPEGHPVIVVEADPRGGQLARRCGADPQRGLASLASAIQQGQRIGPADLALHLQRHPVGIDYLAAPEDPARVSAALAHPLRLREANPGRCERWYRDLVLIADCGVASRTSPAAPLLAGADAVLVVVPAASLVSPDAEQQLRDMADWCPRLAVVTLGEGAPGRRLARKVVGRLPRRDTLSDEVARGRIPWEAAEFSSSCHTLVSTLRARIEPSPATAAAPRPWTPWRRAARTRSAVPGVYAIEHQPLHNALSRDHRPPTQHRTMPATFAHRSPSLVVEPVLRSAGVRESAGSALPTQSAPGAPLAAEPAPVRPGLTMRLFGPLRVIWRPQAGEQAQTPPIEITARLQRRSQEVLALLATHPEGVNRTQLLEALWGRRGTVRPANAIYTTLARLRAAVAQATDGAVDQLLITGSGRYRLNPAAVSVEDYTEYTALAARRRRATDPDEHRAHCTRLIELAATGRLAADLDADWLDAVRNRVRNEAITTVGVLARRLVTDDPHATAHLLEMALDIDPHNEDVFRDLMKLQARHGQIHAIDSTLEILTRRLNELDEQPSSQTIALVRSLHENAN
ncbi:MULTISPECIES: hypothetical protein [unclassified Nocardia]|uniref:hypothetical protein n=1 Tax=unclassified Nocardia TaxID=2637762 RepID=UPI00278C5DFF|nr:MULTISPECIES: hypothetical protein [unclassified Nocardia]